MAHSQSETPFLAQPGSPADGLDDAPPPPVHRVPVGAHADSQHFPSRPSFQHDPNNYSDLSTPGSDPRPLGVPSRSPSSTPFHDQYPYDSGLPPRSMYSNRSYGSQVPLAGAGMYSSNHSLHSMNSAHPAPFTDNPYNRYSTAPMSNAHAMAEINPNDLADDDDWGMGPETPQQKRRSFVPGFGVSRDGSRNGSPGSSIAGGVAGAGAAGGAAAFAVSNINGGSANGSGSHIGGHSELLAEKSEWLKRDHAKRKKRMWIAISIIAFIVIGAILGGVLGALLNRNGGSGHDGQHGSVSAGDVASDNKDDLNKDSSEIKALMNNANLHKVFPGMDYTPLNSQRPDCLTVAPSQNNITRDVAVMSQLTNSIRLYGTDCNQTQMVIHAIQRLELSDMKIWLGVWLDDNNSTNNRQIAQTWDILDEYGCDYFKGIIIGNEVLYREDLTVAQLLTQITNFRQNITSHKCDLPVAMADLGDNWTADMATKVDVVMSNVHPFFSGTSVEDAAAWTWTFWQQNDVALTANDNNIKQVIAEVGWPSGGGTNCGGAASCTGGSVAGIDEMNLFMEDWICPSLKNQTEYFWFSAFDEPWKIRYNEKGKEWEDKWGLMDVNRNLKPGLKIPDCGGAALPSFA
ncbi:glycoside hydrolase superfamily [Boeremia exigua]|uniref:glycoside hydrolase superfamily n=1 Tax=Boeremia exigua TaxID=749465 RepID=UPI001E8CDA93|nr:glycoside hydrolase superfamily [Boeremia exigua]KAH6644085.1 glycoside hydrolase superfamily [Boeremia exigua]